MSEYSRLRQMLASAERIISDRGVTERDCSLPLDQRIDNLIIDFRSELQRAGEMLAGVEAERDEYIRQAREALELKAIAESKVASAWVGKVNRIAALENELAESRAECERLKEDRGEDNATIAAIELESDDLINEAKRLGKAEAFTEALAEAERVQEITGGDWSHASESFANWICEKIACL